MTAPLSDAAWLATLTVLCVEDDELTRDALVQLLRRRVRKVLVATEGTDGLAQFRAERPEIVVTDIRMPGMDGRTLADEIRHLAPATRVILTTAFDQAEDLKRAIEIGIEHFVAKPIDTEHLERALRSSARRLHGEAELDRARGREVESLRAREREAMGLLVGGMAHDFNNLLQSVVGNVELALGLTEPGTELHEFAENALHATAQAIASSHRLSTLSESCYVELRAEPLGPVLEAALATALNGSDTRLHFEPPTELPRVAMDAEMLGRAFEQIARNAREAMSDRGRLFVRSTQREVADGEVRRLTAGRYCEISFSDEGPGVPEELHARIFDACGSTKPGRSAHGMGLGLALARAIVQKHRGAISLASPGGGGAEFTVLLPVHAP
ncbi:MAG: response regulator [Myxococcales bacterium]|nr:response regulator [Myxococcales bacterium]